MPRPKGWTAGEERLRDECVTTLLREGVPPGRTAEQRERSDRQRAFAICTASVEKHRRGGNQTVAEVMAAAKRMFGLGRSNPDSKTGGAYKGYLITPRLTGDFFDVSKGSHHIASVKTVEEAKRMIEQIATGD